jgi:hypothetical protein
MKITAGGLTVTGNLYVSGTITAGSSITGSTVSTPAPVAGNCCASDIRLKHNIVPLTDALGKINKLRGVYFHWNTSIDAVSAYSEKRHVGVIAQEVQAVLPEIVANATKDYLGVDYAFLTPLLIEGIKDLTNKTSELKLLMNNAALPQMSTNRQLSSMQDSTDAVISANSELLSVHESLRNDLISLQKANEELMLHNEQLMESNNETKAKTSTTHDLLTELLQRVAALEE